MDEPLSSLDAKLREDLRVELKRIQRELGATILYVTHDQIEAMTLADRIGVLEDGRLVQLGTPREIYERPANVARRPPAGLAADQPAAGRDRASTARARSHPAGGSAPGGPAPGWRRSGSRVEQVEPLGAETVVLLRMNGTRLHALVSGETGLRPGDVCRIDVAPDAFLFFDGDGRRLAA